MSMPSVPGQHEVEQHEVGLVLVERGDRLVAVRAQHRLVAFSPQHDAEHLGQCRVVVDDEHASFHVVIVTPRGPARRRDTADHRDQPDTVSGESRPAAAQRPPDRRPTTRGIRVTEQPGGESPGRPPGEPPEPDRPPVSADWAAQQPPPQGWADPGYGRQPGPPPPPVRRARVSSRGGEHSHRRCGSASRVGHRRRAGDHRSPVGCPRSPASSRCARWASARSSTARSPRSARSRG